MGYQACVDAAMLLFYGEAQEIVGGSTAQRGDLSQLFYRLPQQSPPDKPNTASQQLINSRVIAIFQAITGTASPRNRAEQRLLETLRNAILIQWNVNNARAITSQVGKSDIPSNLKEEIKLYETALLQEIPQISARVQASVNSKVLSQETAAAWHRLSELMIRLYPAAKASQVDPKLSGAIASAGNQLFEELLKSSSPPTIDGSAGMRRFLPATLTGAGRKIAEQLAQNNWNGLYQQYFEFAIALSRWLQGDGNYRAGNEAQAKADGAATERLEYLKGMGQQLQQFKTQSAGTNPVRLMADFYPQEQAKDGSANRLEKIPLSLYLSQKENQFFGQTNSQWVLTQITPKNAIDVSAPKKAQETNPPQELFDKLNSSNRFPKGIIRYTLPDGTAGMAEVDGNWKLSDWLGFIGLGAGVAALTIFTLGSGTVLVSTIGYPLFYVGAAAQVGSSVANIYERNRDGTINPMQMSLDAVNIVSALTGVGATTAGRFALDASGKAAVGEPYRGMMAKLANFADGWFVPLTATNLAADGATVVLMTADAFRQSQELWEGAGEERDKRKAMALLIAQLAVTSSLITLSIRGNIADLQSGRILVLGEENGVPVVRSTRGTEETYSQTRPSDQAPRQDVSYVKIDELNPRRERVIATCGEQLVDNAEANLAALLNQGEIFISIRKPALEGMLQDGRYKTIFEIKAEEARQNPTGQAAQEITRRGDAEERLFDYPRDLTPENRPAYGYVAREANSPEAGIVAAAYGENIAIKLNREVKSRSTFTGDDSMFGLETGTMTRQPSLFETPNIVSFLSIEDIADVSQLQQKVQRIANAQTLDELMAIKQLHYYFEVQIHGRVTINDVAEIIYMGIQPSQNIIRLARERGVTITIR